MGTIPKKMKLVSNETEVSKKTHCQSRSEHSVIKALYPIIGVV